MKRDIYTEVSARIVAELERGAAPWVKPWKPVAGGNIPQNAATSRPYSGTNVVLLWMACNARGFGSPRFVTFKQALDCGGHVRKGERGAKVYFVKKLEVRDKEAEGDERTRIIPMMREFTVFHTSQCEGLPQYVVNGRDAPKTDAERNADADEFLRSTGADIREGHGEAYYVPSRDFISMPAFAGFKTASHFYGTAFHELGHWTGHRSRLDRDLRHRFGERAYAAEELVAELTAAFLCAEFGFSGDLRHAGYIGHWIALLKDDPRAFLPRQAEPKPQPTTCVAWLSPSLPLRRREALAWHGRSSIQNQGGGLPMSRFTPETHKPAQPSKCSTPIVCLQCHSGRVAVVLVVMLAGLSEALGCCANLSSTAQAGER